MSYTYDFADNKTITADGLNSIITHLGEGVDASFSFEENTAYAVSRLNLIRSEILSGGILSGMNCSTDGEFITVGTGVCFFENGMRLEITEPEIFSLFPGVRNYIYMYASPTCAAALPLISKTPQTGADFIPVAEIENGSITDCRIWCQAKIPLKASSRVTQALSVSYSVPRNQPDFVLAKQIKLLNTGFARIFVYGEDFSGIWNRDDNTYIYSYSYSGNFNILTDASEMIIKINNVTTHKLKFDVTGDMLNVYIYAHTEHPGTSNLSGSFKIELI